MIQCQLKLRLSTAQEKRLNSWLPILGAVWNFAIRKIELNANNKIYFSKYTFQNLLAGHGEKLGIPSHTLQGVLLMAHMAWGRCFKGISRKPRLKGRRRPLNSIPLPDPIKAVSDGFVKLPVVGKVRFHKQDIPKGKIKCSRICKRASGWYLCLFIDAQPVSITRTGNGIIGVDPGFKDLVTLSTGEKVVHPQEFRRSEQRLGQAQRGLNKVLMARMSERVRNRRKDRNHKLSRRLVSENKTIFFLKDNHRAVAKSFGKSVSDSGHGELKTMLQYKCLTGGTELVFSENRNSTRACSTCRALTGPTGLAGLKVRNWTCAACGAEHERDVNAARNAINFGAGSAHEVAHVN